MISSTTATSIAIVVHLYCLFGYFKRFFNCFTHKNISIKFFTEELSSLIVDQVLGINHYNELNTYIEKGSANFLGVTRIDKYYLWEEIGGVF